MAHWLHEVNTDTLSNKKESARIVMIAHCFTCGEGNICKNIKKFHNIMKMILDLWPMLSQLCHF